MSESDPQRPEDPEPPGAATGRREVDRGALLGAALAAVVALTFGGQGEWDLLAGCVGVALLTVLGAFYRLPRGPQPARVLAELAAVSAVAALAAVPSWRPSGSPGRGSRPRRPKRWCRPPSTSTAQCWACAWGRRRRAGCGCPRWVSAW